jgi:hypothetical protein
MTSKEARPKTIESPFKTGSSSASSGQIAVNKYPTSRAQSSAILTICAKLHKEK